MTKKKEPKKDVELTCVVMWVQGDVPEGYDWGRNAPPGCEIDTYAVKSFPWSDVYHEVNWWIMRPMTIEEWIALDEAESKTLAKIVGGDKFMGTAGPIPGTGELKGEDWE